MRRKDFDLTAHLARSAEVTAFDLEAHLKARQPIAMVARTCDRLRAKGKGMDRK